MPFNVENKIVATSHLIQSADKIVVDFHKFKKEKTPEYKLVYKYSRNFYT